MRSFWAKLNMNESPDDIWPVTTPGKKEKLAGKHPPQKPSALLERIILASTWSGDIILDPFTGSSTTALAAAKSRRKFIGIDNNVDYLKLSAMRLEAQQTEPNSVNS